MQRIIPQLLKKGDEIRVVAPATSCKIIGADCRQIAKERFEQMGLKVSFGQNTTDDNFDMLASTEIKKRADDIMAAFRDKSIKAIFTMIGGFNSNQLLPFLDYEVIKNNPKIICGFSDITALLNGIYAKTGLVTFYGPHYSSIGMKKGCEYTLECLQQMLFKGKYLLKDSPEWSDDLWFIDQEKREFVKNDGRKIWYEANAEGWLVGGNLGTLMLLGGTQYQPKFEKDTILMVEDCFTSADADVKTFMRQLQSLAQRDDFVNVKAVLIGRFQKASKVSAELLDFVITSIPQLERIPVIANLDFGHTTPIATLPIGGYCEITNHKIEVSLVNA